MNDINNLIKKFETLGGKISGLNLKQMGKQFEAQTRTLIVTDECNLRCTYCYCTDKKPNYMSWDTAKEYIDLTFDVDADLYLVPKAQQIPIKHRIIWDFIGGEPLIASEVVFKCIEYVTERIAKLPDNHPWKRSDWPCDCGNANCFQSGYRFMIQTNGYVLEDPAIRRFLEKHKHHTQVGITVDGPKDMHDMCRVTTDGKGSHDTIMRSWDWYKNTFPGSASTTKSTIAPENLPYLNQIAKYFIEELGMTTISQNCVFENVWSHGDHFLLLDNLCDLADYLIEGKKYEKFAIRWFDTALFGASKSEGKWCGAGSGMEGCDYQGKLYPCLRFKTLSHKEPFVLGDVKSGSNKDMLAIFQNEDNYKDKQKIDGYLNLKCSTCPASARCGDCQAWGYDCFGYINMKTPFICPMHKANVVANMYFFGKIFGIMDGALARDQLLVMLDDWTAEDYFSVDASGNKVDFETNKATSISDLVL